MSSPGAQSYPPIPVSPPSPPPAYSGGGGGGKSSAFSPAVVAIIAVLGSAFLVVSYYRIFSKLCTRWQNRRDGFDMDGHVNGAEMDATASPLPSRGLDEALIKKISVFLYKSGDGFTVDTDCPVCLMEFVDNQELRMLPKCAHAFHVACIDTWLTTHSTCPLCRASIWPVEVMSRYPYSPQVTIYGRGDAAHVALDSDRMDYQMGDGHRFIYGDHGRSSAPTLRGLLNYEDQHHDTLWIPGLSERRDPGDESIRLYDSRDHGGDSSSRHHSDALSATPGSTAPTISENPDFRSGPYFSADSGPQVPLARTASFKEPHSRSRDRDHRWRIPARRPSFRRNPFSIVRSYSMGTSRRLVHALEFLDLEDMRNSQSKGGEKLFCPHEYGITETPDCPTNMAISPTDLLSSERRKSSAAAGGAHEQAAGPSSQVKEVLRPPSNLPDSSSDPDLQGAALKSSGPGKGRSLSFRSPFNMKRSVSGGKNVFSFRHTRAGRVFSFSDFPILPGP